jgi:hypothetical protein
MVTTLLTSKVDIEERSSNYQRGCRWPPATGQARRCRQEVWHQAHFLTDEQLEPSEA